MKQNRMLADLPDGKAYRAWLIEEWRPWCAAHPAAGNAEFQSHSPRPPHLSYEQYYHWVFDEIVPELARRGEMTEEKLIADFMNNEGRVTHWPDFGDL